MLFILRRAHLGRYRQITTTAARRGLLPRLESATLADRGSAVSANRSFWSANVLSLQGEPVVDDVGSARASVRWPIALTAIVVASLLALALACGGGEQQVSGPRLLLKGDTFDLGSVAPGEKGNLVFTLKGPEGAKGMKDTMLVDLKTNDPDRPQRTITIKYKIE